MSRAGAFPIVRHPANGTALPVLVSIPHYGTAPLPGVDAGHYANPAYTSFPLGYVDRFAAELYGALHRLGATVVATPYSRLFVDVNRRRNDFKHEEGSVYSQSGVVRTHSIHHKPIFSAPLSRQELEARLRGYYDPYHITLQAQLTGLLSKYARVLLLDAHTASARGLGEHETVVSTSRGKTARDEVAEMAADTFRERGFRIDRDVTGYAGGYIVRRYGRERNERVDAVQIEVNTSLLLTTSRKEMFDQLDRGETPDMHVETAQRLRECARAIVTRYAEPS